MKDLEPMIGRSNRVYKILSRKRPLTLKMIWALHRKLGIPAESLVRPSKKAHAALSSVSLLMRGKRILPRTGLPLGCLCNPALLRL